MLDLRRILPKYFRKNLHENAVLTVGLTDKSDYSIYYFMVILFIYTVYTRRHGLSIYMLRQRYEKSTFK